jgi:hypothetical protein
MPAEGRFAAVGLSAEAELTFVPWESSAAESLGMTRGEIRAYPGDLLSGDGPIHRLLGHPDPVTETCSLNASSPRTACTAGTPAATGIRGLPG